jgi:hypothetical protein
MTDRIDNDPADNVEVPGWLREIEERANASILNPSAMQGDIERMTREYRELLVVLHDLRQDAGPLYVVVMEPWPDNEMDEVQGVFRSQTEACRWAEQRAADPEVGRWATAYRVEAWQGTSKSHVAKYTVTDPDDDDDAEEVDEDEQDDDSECYQCGGEGTVEVGPDHTEVECPRCNGSGEERE